jgi:N-acetylglucosamine malate deacetylase 1
VINPKRILVLAPHTDDGELGCGGTLARFIEGGSEVFYAAFSVCEQSVPYGFSEDELEREMLEATAVLGIQRRNVIINRFPVRRFPEYRQAILQDIWDRKKDINPDLVLIPCPTDLHQDHQVISMEGLRVYKDTTVLCYEMPWNNLTFATTAFVALTEKHVACKAEAIARYRTQTFREYTSREYITAAARTRGVQVKAAFAEAFEVARLRI